MRKIFITLLSAVLFLSSCSDWTKTESQGYHRLTPAEADPEGYRNYLAALREFKKTDHPVSMITVRAVENPAHQSQHLIGLPDSVDYICLKGITGLGSVIVDEMKQVRDQKGTKVYCVVDYASIVESWNALWHGTPEDPDADDNRTPDEFKAYCTEQTDFQLSQFDKYGFDGVQISYLGNLIQEIDKKGQDAFMSRIVAWRASHSDAPLMFRGYWSNLDSGHASYSDYQAILGDCAYLVAVPMNIVTVPTGMDEYVQRQLRGIANDSDLRNRIVYEVSIPAIDNPQQIGVTLEQAAEWTLLPLAANTPDRNKFSKKGMSVDNAQDDYFNATMIYLNIRQALSLMNSDVEEQD